MMYPEPPDVEVYRWAIWHPHRRGLWEWVDPHLRQLRSLDTAEIAAREEMGLDPILHVLEGPFPEEARPAVNAAYVDLTFLAQAGIFSEIPLRHVVTPTRADVFEEAGFPSVMDDAALETLALYEAWYRLGPADLPRDASAVRWWLMVLAWDPDAGERYWEQTPAQEEGVSFQEARQIVDIRGGRLLRRPRRH
jgi:hypothetical protein